jgi:hypothetical protein
LCRFENVFEAPPVSAKSGGWNVNGPGLSNENGVNSTWKPKLAASASVVCWETVNDAALAAVGTASETTATAATRNLRICPTSNGWQA